MLYQKKMYPYSPFVINKFTRPAKQYDKAEATDTDMLRRMVEATKKK